MRGQGLPAGGSNSCKMAFSPRNSTLGCRPSSCSRLRRWLAPQRTVRRDQMHTGVLTFSAILPTHTPRKQEKQAFKKRSKTRFAIHLFLHINTIVSALNTNTKRTLMWTVF